MVKYSRRKHNSIAREAADDKSPQGPALPLYFNLAYAAGPGAKTSQGLGMVEVVNTLFQTEMSKTEKLV